MSPIDHAGVGAGSPATGISNATLLPAFVMILLSSPILRKIFGATEIIIFKILFNFTANTVFVSFLHNLRMQTYAIQNVIRVNQIKGSKTNDV